MSSNLKLVTIALLSSALIACNDSKSDEHTGDSDTDTLATATDSSASQQSNFLLPSPLQIAYIFKKSGLNYVAGTTHDIAKEASYTSSYSQSVNLGVYSADLAYCSLNKQQQEAINYMKVVKSLSNKLGMSSVFNTENLAKRFESNISKEDSVMLILSELQNRSETFFHDNDRRITAAYVFSGAWIEGIYIATRVINTDKDNKITRQLADQVSILDNLIKELTKYQAKEENSKQLLAKLGNIRTLILAISGIKEIIESPNPAGIKVAPTEQQLQQLNKEVGSLRNTIVNA